MSIIFEDYVVVKTIEGCRIECDTCGTVFPSERCGGDCRDDLHDEDCYGAQAEGWKLDFERELAVCPECLYPRLGENDRIVSLKCDNCWKEEKLEQSKALYYGWQYTIDEISGTPTIVDCYCPECVKKRQQSDCVTGKRTNTETVGRKTSI